MKNSENQITPLQRQILLFIADHPLTLPLDILEHIFDDDPSKQSKMYYNLDALKKKKLINSLAVKKKWGASSPRFLYLLSSGSKLIGRDHIPTTFRNYSFEAFLMKRAMLELTYLCKQNKWLLFEKNDE